MQLLCGIFLLFATCSKPALPSHVSLQLFQCQQACKVPSRLRASSPADFSILKLLPDVFLLRTGACCIWASSPTQLGRVLLIIFLLRRFSPEVLEPTSRSRMR